MAIEYDIKVFPLSEEDGGGFLAEVPELPGCIASGDTMEETLVLLEDAISSWKMSVEESGGIVPEPTYYREAELPSGRFSVRIPRTLHKELIQIAKDEDQSLNSLVSYLLTQAVAGNILKKTAQQICQNATQISKKMEEMQMFWKTDQTTRQIKPRFTDFPWVKTGVREAG